MPTPAGVPMASRSPGCSGHDHGRDVEDQVLHADTLAAFPGLSTSDDDPVAALAKRIAGRNDHIKVAYGAEAGLFSEAGIPTAVCGPGSIAQAHKPDEFVTAEQLAACERLVRRLINELC